MLLKIGFVSMVCFAAVSCVKKKPESMAKSSPKLEPFCVQVSGLPDGVQRFPDSTFEQVESSHIPGGVFGGQFIDVYPDSEIDEYKFPTSVILSLGSMPLVQRPTLPWPRGSGEFPNGGGTQQMREAREKANIGRAQFEEGVFYFTSMGLNGFGKVDIQGNKVVALNLEFKESQLPKFKGNIQLSLCQ